MKRAFHRFGQTVLCYGGGMVLGLNRFLIMPPLPKKDAGFISGQNLVKNNQLALFT